MKHILTLISLLTPLLASLLTPLLLTSCSEDLTYENPQKDEGYSNVTFSGYGGGWSNGRPGTRAASAKDVSECTPANPMSIGVWGYYLKEGTVDKSGISAVGSPIWNDYKVYDVKKNTDKYTGTNPNTSTSYYQSLVNYYFPYAPDAATHLDFVTQQYHYGVGADVLGEQDGGFPWENTQYMFYCYAPHANDITESIVTARLLSSLDPEVEYPGASPSKPDDATSGMNYIKLSGLPSITNRDIAIGQQRRPWSRLSVSGYESSYGSCVDFTQEGYELQHLYAAVQFCFALDEKYAEQRYLHIKDVTITTDEAFKADDKLKVTTYTITKDITSKDGALGDPVETAKNGTPRAIVIGEWTPTNQFLLGVKSEKGIIINDPGKLSATYQPGDAIPYVKDSEKYFAFGNLYLWPQDNKERTGPSTYLDTPKQFKINVRYDVYDRTGQKTRENATANSIMTFPNTGTGAITDYVAGSYYNILIKIKPDFLYVLSDTDASADVIITGGK